MATNVRDPRSIITPDAFAVDEALLGTPLAAPSRRAFALLIDLIVIGTLTAITSSVTLLVWGALAIFLISMAFRRPRMGQLTGMLFRGATGCLGLALLMGVGIIYLATRGDNGMREVERALADLDENVAGTPRTPSTPGLPGLGDLIMSGFAGAGALRSAQDTAEARVALEELLGAMAAGGVGANELEEAASELEGMVPADAPWRDDFDIVVERAVAAQRLADDRAPGDAASDPLASETGDVAGAGEPAAALPPEIAALVADTLEALEGSLADARAREVGLSGQLEDARGELDDARDELEANQGGFIELLADIWEQLGSAIGLWSVYFTVATTLTHGRTLGKKALGLRVVRLDGGPITWWFAFERAGGYVAGIATGLLGFAQIYWDPNRQCVHDKIGGTVVVVDGADPIPGAWQEAWHQQQQEREP